MSISSADALGDVHALLALPAASARSARGRVEHTLTTGYAHALDLERDRLRIERRLRDAIRDEATTPTDAAELRSRLEGVESELARVRALLSSLRAHALG